MVQSQFILILLTTVSLTLGCGLNDRHDEVQPNEEVTDSAEVGDSDPESAVQLTAEQRDAIRDLERLHLGAGVNPPNAPTSITLSNGRVKDEDLVHLRALSDLSITILDLC